MKLKDYTQKMNLLKCCSSLAKCDEYKNVYISPDRTKRQQLADFKLRQELCHLRENGQTDFYIRRGTITKKKVATPQTQEESNMVSLPQLHAIVNIYVQKPPAQNSLSCFYVNARCVVNKFDELECYVTELKPDVIFFTESWANKYIASAELSLNCYTMYRRDRHLDDNGEVIR